MEILHTSIEDLGLFKIVVSLDDHDISQQVRENRWYSDERFETSVFAAQLRPGMNVLDIGGNIGFYSMFARSIVGAEGSVVVFEPYPRSAELIQASIEVNEYKNIHLIKAAVSDGEGLGKLFLSPDLWTEHSLLDLGHALPSDEGLFHIEVPLVTIDAALEQLGHDMRIDVIKMDIEGAEWRALKGMQRIMDQNSQLTIMTEFWPNGFIRAGTTPRRFLDVLRDAGFAFQHINSEVQQLEQMTVEEIIILADSNAARSFENSPVMQAWGWYTNLLCLRGEP